MGTMMVEAEMAAPVRSSLERMLDAIRIRDVRTEGAAPPALPCRPTSRGRLPSSRRRLPLLPVQVKDGGRPAEGWERVKEKKAAVLGLDSMPGLESYEERSENGPDPAFGMGAIDVDPMLRKIAEVEDDRTYSLNGILWVQKRFRGRQARHSFQELRRGVTTLQSFVRGERTRSGFEYMSKRWKAAVVVQKHVKRWIARNTFDHQRKDAILLQSVIRGWQARKHMVVLKKLELQKPCGEEVTIDPSKNLEEIEGTGKEHPEVCPSVLAELQRRVVRAEVALKHKEEENVVLQEQLQQYETRWSEYEAKMKSMEQTWQIQLAALQVSLAAAKKSLNDDSPVRPPGKFDESYEHLYFDSEDSISFETMTPDSTPAKQPRHRYSSETLTTDDVTPAKQPLPRSSDAKLSRKSDGARNGVGQLVQEFEQRSLAFEENAVLLIEAKSGKSNSTVNPDEEFRNLKVRFEAWKKDYKLRLQETKATLKKLGNSEPKPRKRWWTPSCTR